MPGKLLDYGEDNDLQMKPSVLLKLYFKVRAAYPSSNGKNFDLIVILHGASGIIVCL